LHLEPGVRASASLVGAIAGALDDLVRFLGGRPGSWVLFQANPPEVLPLLSAAPDRA